MLYSKISSGRIFTPSSTSSSTRNILLFFSLSAVLLTSTRTHAQFLGGTGPYDFPNGSSDTCATISYFDITSASGCSAAATYIAGAATGPPYDSLTYGGTITNNALKPGCIITGMPPTQQAQFNLDAGNPSDGSTIYICQQSLTTSSGGDPHFIGFHQNLITYQGECTLILLDSPSATASGDDVTVHVRTTRKLDFSYISGVAMKIGDDVMELKPNGALILNGQVISGDDVTMSGLPFVVTKEEKGTKKMIVSYSFDLGNGRIIDVQANKKRSMMFVRTKGSFPAETQGMLGSPAKTEMVSRDGVKLSEMDVNAYGESWQVKDTDVQLFQEAVGPQYPEKCLYEDAPGATSQLRGRRKLLVKKVVTLEDARAACADVPAGVKRELCIQDSIAMGDVDLKDDPFYME